jgi:arginyl-tRNA synthetase
MEIKEQLLDIIQSAIFSTFKINIEKQEIVLEDTPKDFEGSYTLVTFPIAKKIRQSPDLVAETTGKHLVINYSNIISNYNVIKGFLNLEISNEIWLEQFKNIEAAIKPEKSKETILVEFCSPNTNKPLHLGHLRNICLGQAITNILKFMGHQVYKINQINDRGIHISKSMAAYKMFSQGETPTSTNTKGDHFVGKYYVAFEKECKKEISKLIKKTKDADVTPDQCNIMHQAREMLKKWEANDADTLELWEKMNNWVYQGFEQTYNLLNLSFDKTYYESQTYINGKDVVKEGLEKGIFYTKEDGSVWVDLSDEGLGEKLLIRSDGTTVYITQDLGNADLRYSDYNFDQCIYVVGDEQDYHFKVLFSILKKLNRPYADKLTHLSYGMVNLPMGKMKSREGTVVDADDIIEQMITSAQTYDKEAKNTQGNITDNSQKHKMIGLGALKFFLLRINSKKKLLFNPSESIDLNGNTGPFIQYTYARINSVLNKSGFSEIKSSDLSIDYIKKLHIIEKDLIKMIQNFNTKIEQAANEQEPAVIAQYVFDLAKLYNRMYAELNILNNEDKNITKMRLFISKNIGSVIKQSMSMLSIDMPEQM